MIKNFLIYFTELSELYHRLHLVIAQTMYIYMYQKNSFFFFFGREFFHIMEKKMKILQSMKNVH